MDNTRLESCYLKLQEILGFMKEKRNELDKMRNEFNDNIKKMDDIISMLVAEDAKMHTSSDIEILKQELQSLTEKIDCLLMQQKESNKVVFANPQKHEEAVVNVDKNMQSKNVCFAKENNVVDVKVLRTTEDKELSELILSEVEKFLQDYNSPEMAGYINLTVMLEYQERLAKSNLLVNEAQDFENLCLQETARGQAYQAKHLNILYKNESNYFLVAPVKLCQKLPFFNVKSVIEEAYIAFFDFKNEEFTTRGRKGKLIRPAVFQKVDGMYQLKKKGEIELL